MADEGIDSPGMRDEDPYELTRVRACESFSRRLMGIAIGAVEVDRGESEGSFRGRWFIAGAAARIRSHDAHGVRDAVGRPAVRGRVRDARGRSGVMGRWCLSRLFSCCL